jgi:Na+-transporting NADH:ubiquinone oxidoreductase subunit C
MSKGNGFTIGFAAAICVVCSLAVSAAAIGLKEMQDDNKRRDAQSSILGALGLPEDGSQLQGEAIDDMFKARVVKQFIDQATGNKLELSDEEAEAATTEKPDSVISVYNRIDGESIGAIAIPLEGMGLWGPISGYLAVNAEATEVMGTTFFAPKETPGLGAEILKAKFQDPWIGKKITKDGATKPIKVVKGEARYLCLDAEFDYCVDGVSGATITSRGVSDMVAEAFVRFDPFLSATRGGN